MPASKKKKDSSAFLGYLYTYFASLIAIGTIIPIVAAVITALFYISFPTPAAAVRANALQTGIITTLVVWVVAAIVYCPFATSKGANMRSYGLLDTTICQLENILQQHLCSGASNQPQPQQPQQSSQPATPPLQPQQPQQPIAQQTVQNKTNKEEDSQTVALQEAREILNTLQEKIDEPGLQWVFATGYISMWNLLHRALEALVEGEPTDTVVREALSLKWSIQNSQMDAKVQKELLAKLNLAVNDLSPSSMIYFDQQQSDAKKGDAKNGDASATSPTEKKTTVGTLTSTQGIISRIGLALDVFRAKQTAHTQSAERPGVGDDASATNTSKNSDEVDAHKCARAVIRGVKTTLDMYRDDQWEGLVRSRNQLMGAVVGTGLATYFLLAIVVARSIDPAQLASAMGIYGAGAAAGLFGRLYSESQIDRRVDDYGLFRARLLANLVLSGLAGIGGVLITVMLFSALLMPQTGGSNTNPPTPTPAPKSAVSSIQSTIAPASLSLKVSLAAPPTPTPTPTPMPQATQSCKGAGINDERCITPESVLRPDFMLFIVAGVFGLFPNLIISIFLRQGQQYVSNLKASDPQDQSNPTSASNT